MGGPRNRRPLRQSRRPMVERKLRPAPSTLHLLPSRKPAKTGGAHASKLFVLDTNVLLHDPTSLFRFEEHDICLPIFVLEELDNKKKGMTEVARNARQASRFLDEIVSDAPHKMEEGIALNSPMHKNCTGRLFLQTSYVQHELPQHLDLGKADNAILGVVIALQKQ